jgi:hypothetical protein
MAVLLSMEGKYYDIPDDQAASFEVPREKVRDVLAHAAPAPSAQGGPGAGPASGRPPMGSPMGGSPVIIQVLPNGLRGPAPANGPAPAGAGGQPDGEVDPYWYYYTWWRNWSNYW